MMKSTGKLFLTLMLALFAVAAAMNGEAAGSAIMKDAKMAMLGKLASLENQRRLLDNLMKPPQLPPKQSDAKVNFEPRVQEKSVTFISYKKPPVSIISSLIETEFKKVHPVLI